MTRVISGILHALKSGGRWIDAPDVYGPHKTLNTGSSGGLRKGVWIDIFDILASAGGPPAQVLIDSSAVKAHRCASGGKLMARPLVKWLDSSGLDNLRKRIRPFGNAVAKMQIRASGPHKGAGVDAPFCAIGFQVTGRLSAPFDRLADNFLAAVCLAATVSYWL